MDVNNKRMSCGHVNVPKYMFYLTHRLKLTSPSHTITSNGNLKPHRGDGAPKTPIVQ